MTRDQALNQALISLQSARSILGWAVSADDIAPALDEIKTAIEMLKEVQHGKQTKRMAR
jgi:hypothetical protein